MPDDSIIYTVDELAQVWKVCPRTVYNLIASGKLQAFKCGSSYRITDRARLAYEEGKA